MAEQRRDIAGVKGAPGMLVVALVLALLGLPRPLQAAPARHLLVVSIDGLSWQRLQPLLPRLPHLEKLARQGAAGPLQSVFPSMTWAAHTSLATGLLPGRHGVLGNRFVDRRRGELVEAWQRDRRLNRGQALWDLAKDAGWSTAALLWPQTSQASRIDWNVPEVYGQRSFEQGSAPGTLEALSQLAGLPKGLMGRLGGEEMFLLDSWSRDAAVALIERHKPRLLMTHFLAVDTLGHSYGADSVAYRWGLELADRYLGELLAAYRRAGLDQGLLVCVVSDHGFLDLRRSFGPAAALKKAPLSAKERKTLRWAINGQALFLYASGRDHGGLPWQPERGKPSPAQKALAKMAAWLPQQPEVERVILPKDYAALGLGDPEMDPNLPDVIALLAPDVLALFGGNAALRGQTKAGGHGYLPEFPPLLGTFVLAGAGVPAGLRLEGMQAIDVAPTLAAALGWLWSEPRDGKVRQELLSNTSP